MYKKAKLRAAFVLQDRFLDSESEDNVLDLDYSNVNADYSDLFSATGSRLRPKSRSRSISRASSETE